MTLMEMAIVDQGIAGLRADAERWKTAFEGATSALGSSCERIAELEAENAALRAKAANMDSWDLRLFPVCGHFAPNNAIGADGRCPVCAENAELRKDKARLDWLGTSRVSPVWHFSSLDGSDGWGCTFVDGYAWGRGQTVRDAIDDVMSRVKGWPLRYCTTVQYGRIMERLKIGRIEFGPAGTWAWLTAEKHTAQADAEREKNTADTLRIRVSELEAEVERLKRELKDRTPKLRPGSVYPE